MLINENNNSQDFYMSSKNISIAMKKDDVIVELPLDSSKRN